MVEELVCGMSFRFASRCVLKGLIGSFFLAAVHLCAAEKLQFNRDIRPLLSDRCFRCHGPDKASRKAGLRLDQAAEAYAEGREKGTHPIVPRQPEKSLVVQRIFSQDDEEVMPPAKSHLTLDAEE